MSLGSSRNALHVLRLLWARPPLPRHFSTAVFCPSDYPSSDRTTVLYPSSHSSTSHSASSSSSSTTVTTDFLEDEVREKEYRLASLLLNPSSEALPTPIPWPTIFPPETTSLPATRTSERTRTHRCDPLARHVAAGDLETGRIIYNELKALHIGILHRRLYLDAAISCLDGTTKGKEDFLFWLALVPNKPATRPHPKSKAVWSVMVEKMLDLYTQDASFMTDVLRLLAKKGALPDILGPIMRHLTMLIPPEESRDLMDSLVSAYGASVAPTSSPTRRAEIVRSLARNRIGNMWKTYLSALHAAGWQSAARALLAQPPAGVSWSTFTQELLDSPSAPTQVDDSWKQMLESKPRVVRHIIRAKRETIKPALLADIIGELREADRESLISRLENRYISDSAAAPWRKETWYHANLLFLIRSGQAADAVDLFARHFMWIGIPALPSPSTTNASTSAVVESSISSRKLYPSKGVITSILPHLLARLPAAGIAEYHTSYLALSRTVAPKMRPTAATHSALLRAVTHLLGPDAGVLALHRTLEAGYDPGLAAYTALLCSLAGNNRLHGMVEVLRDMENGAKVNAVQMPYPTRETYLAIAGVLERAGQEEVAEAMRIRVRQVRL